MGLSPANQGHICRAACYLIGLNSRMGLRVFEPSTWNIQMSWAVFFGRGRRRKRRRRGGGPNQPTVRVARCPFLRNSRNPAASAALSSPPRAQWCGFVSLSGRWSEVQVQFLHFFLSSLLNYGHFDWSSRLDPMKCWISSDVASMFESLVRSARPLFFILFEWLPFDLIHWLGLSKVKAHWKLSKAFYLQMTWVKARADWSSWFHVTGR